MLAEEAIAGRPDPTSAAGAESRAVVVIHLFSVIGRRCHKYHSCRDKTVFVVTKRVFCCDESMLAATKVLL